MGDELHTQCGLQGSCCLMGVARAWLLAQAHPRNALIKYLLFPAFYVRVCMLQIAGSEEWPCHLERRGGLGEAALGEGGRSESQWQCTGDLANRVHNCVIAQSACTK